MNGSAGKATSPGLYAFTQPAAEEAQPRPVSKKKTRSPIRSPLMCFYLTDDWRDYLDSSSLRTISAPALKALSLPRATWRDKGVMPQLVDG